MSRHHALGGAGVVAAIGMLLLGTALAQTTQPRRGVNAAEDIHDIRGPKSIASQWWVPLSIAVAAAGIGAGSAAWAWRRRRRLRERSPQEIALAHLDAARGLMQTGNSRMFSTQLSNIVRQYIEDAFGVVATHLTTEEFLHHFAHSPDSVLIKNRELAGDFLQSCDLAKFGGWHMTAPGMALMWDSARRFIVESARARGATSQDPSTDMTGAQETYDSLPSA